MDHGFLSRRGALRAVTEGLLILSDVSTILAITLPDLEQVSKRCDPLIKDDAVRECILRRSGRLGLLLQDIDGICTRHLISYEDPDSLLKEAGTREWVAFLKNTGSKHVRPHVSKYVRERLEEIKEMFSALRDEASAVELDAGASSESDYSDSHTESSDSGSNGDESLSEELGSSDSEQTDETDETDATDATDATDETDETDVKYLASRRVLTRKARRQTPT